MNASTSSGLFANLDHFGRRRLFQVAGLLAVFSLFIFISAGKFDFLWGWAYFGIALFSLVFGGAYVLRINPQAINERGRPAESQKNWDKVILAVYSPLALAVYVVCGLDERFSWTQSFPLWLHWLGALGVSLGSLLSYAAMAHNKYLAQVVQVVNARGHQVADTGPYAVIRHPMYLSIIFSWPSIAFLLGLYWGLLPAGMAITLIVIRTVLEDRTLLDELPGYAEYAQSVRHRLIPGIW